MVKDDVDKDNLVFQYTDNSKEVSVDLIIVLHINYVYENTEVLYNMNKMYNILTIILFYLFIGYFYFKKKRISSFRPSKYICVKKWILGNLFFSRLSNLI